MKKSILIMIITGTLAASTFSCNTNKENVEEAKQNVNEANKELEEANLEYIKEMEQYKKETADKIAANEKVIKSFNDRIDQQKKEEREIYKAKIAELNQQNSDMKMRMENYKADGKASWETFKSEFNSDMDKLGNALKNFTENNVK